MEGKQKADENFFGEMSDLTSRGHFVFHATIYGHAGLALMCCTKGMTCFMCLFSSSSFFISARMRLFSAGRALVSCSESDNTQRKRKGTSVMDCICINWNFSCKSREQSRATRIISLQGCTCL